MKTRGILIALTAIALAGCTSLLTTAPEIKKDSTDDTGLRVIETNFTEISTVMEYDRNVTAAVAYQNTGDDMSLLLSNSLLHNANYSIEEGAPFVILLKDGTDLNLNAKENKTACMRCMGEGHFGQMDVRGTVSSYPVTVEEIEKIRDIGPNMVRLYTSLGYVDHDLNQAAEERWVKASALFLEHKQKNQP